MKLTKIQFQKIVKKVLNEDGHSDVPSARRKLRTSIEDAHQILDELDRLGDHENLPSWWMSKITLAANYLNKTRDYLIVPSGAERVHHHEDDMIGDLLNEIQLDLSDAEVSAAKDKLSDEGGAAGPDMVAQAVKDAEEGDPDVDDEAVLAALMDADDDIKRHEDGDIIDTSNLAESRLTRMQLRKILLEELGKAAPFGSGYKQAKLKGDKKKLIGHT
jgi:hypothetical protein